MARTVTPSQTVGPFFHDALPWEHGEVVAGPDVPGDRIAIEGRVFDGAGAPVPDALIEIWQANAAGRYAHPEDVQEKPLTPGFRGAGRTPTAKDGSFRFVSVKPGRVPGRGNSLQAPHIMVSVFMRGLVKHVASRVYFPDETTANAADGVLALVPAERRGTLIATAQGNGTLRWDVVLQGPAETVFFDI